MGFEEEDCNKILSRVLLNKVQNSLRYENFQLKLCTMKNSIHLNYC